MRMIFVSRRIGTGRTRTILGANTDDLFEVSGLMRTILGVDTDDPATSIDLSIEKKNIDAAPASLNAPARHRWR